MVLIVSILMGISAIANYLIPLLIGAQGYGFSALERLCLLAGSAGIAGTGLRLFLGGFETGWTGYPPLSVRGPMGMQMFFLRRCGLSGWSSILGALNLIATIVRMRTPGMTVFNMPILAWAVLATSIIAMTATQLIGLSFQMVLIERLLSMGFFEPAKGGNPILFQHLFWFYSHPAVYIFVLPGLGVISELLPVFVRKPLFGYRWVAMSSMGIALVGFLVWAHHMFAAGMEEYLRVPIYVQHAAGGGANRGEVLLLGGDDLAGQAALPDADAISCWGPSRSSSSAGSPAQPAAPFRPTCT